MFFSSNYIFYRNLYNYIKLAKAKQTFHAQCKRAARKPITEI